MAALSSATESRILVLGFGLTTTCAVLGLMRHMLIAYRDSVEVKKPSPKTQYITQGTEDSLKSSTLEKLIESHNYGIQETAARIVADRALHDGATLDALLWELTRPDRDRREQAIRALYMLTEQRMCPKYFLLSYLTFCSVAGMAELNSPKVFGAIVTCLARCVKDVPHNQYDKEFDNFDFRDPVERFCLLVLFRLTTEFGSEEIIKAGIVPRWLAKEPWGSTEKEIQENFKHCYHNMRLSELILRIAHHSRGLGELVETNLMDTSDTTFFPRPKMISEDSTAGEHGLSDLGLTEGGPRIREQSAEERHLRRRHREAMVLNDGVQPVGVSNIIEREYMSPIDERRQ
jgi:hypothetical protein